MKLTEEDLIAAVENLELSASEREAAAAELVERCRKDESLRDRYCMRMVTFLADEMPAIRGLGIVGVLLCDEDLEHLPRVVRLLADPSPGVRLQAIHALAPLGMDGLDGKLAALLSDEDRLVRVAAASALAVTGDIRATSVLLDALTWRRTRFEALDALRYLVIRDEANRPRILRAVRGIFSGFLTGRFDRLAAAMVLVALGDEKAKAYLLDRAKRGRLDRPMAIEWLGEARLEKGEELLRQIAANREDPFRGAALRGLGSYGSQAALSTCVSVLRDEGEDADVRCDAAEGLLLLGGEEAHEVLRDASMTAKDEKVRRVASLCLHLFGKPTDEVRLYLPLSGEEIIST